MSKKRKLTLKRLFSIILLSVFFLLLRFVFLKYASIALESMNNGLVTSKSIIFEKINNYTRRNFYVYFTVVY